MNSPIVPASRSPGTILVAEDDDAVRDLTCRLLTRSGYSVLTAADGTTALDMVRADSNRVDLLLTDLLMPGLGGRELADQAAALRPGLRVVFMTGSGESPPPADGAGPPTILRKPFAPSDLERCVRAALGHDGQAAPSSA